MPSESAPETAGPLEVGSGSGDGAAYDVDAEMDDDDYSIEGSGPDVYPDDYRDDYRDYDDDSTDDFGDSGGPERDPGNTFSNAVDFEPEDTNRVPGSSVPSGAHKARMSLARAVTVLVCPTLVAWIGTFI